MPNGTDIDWTTENLKAKEKRVRTNISTITYDPAFQNNKFHFLEEDMTKVPQNHLPSLEKFSKIHHLEHRKMLCKLIHNKKYI